MSRLCAFTVVAYSSILQPIGFLHVFRVVEPDAVARFGCHYLRIIFMFRVKLNTTFPSFSAVLFLHAVFQVALEY